MADSTTIEGRAIEAVARHHGASRAPGEDPPHALLDVAGRQIAVQVAVVPTRGHEGTRARLRDDRVARRFLQGLETAADTGAPRAGTVIFTLGAPIRRPRETGGVLAEALASRLAIGATGVDERLDILGNRVRFRILGEGSMWTSRAVGFVFSGDIAPGDLSTAIIALHREIARMAHACTPDRFAGDWWLVVAGGDRIADVGTWRRAVSRLRLPDRFAKILIVGDGGRVETVPD